ncbi:MAG: phage tail protein [Clostridia bacterium]|nr:phage tail protein [Clostridia bacterium]
MVVGGLGDITFEVSEETVKTLQNFQRSGSARVQTHARHMQTGLVEFTGKDPGKIAFDMRISKLLGEDPYWMMRRLDIYMTEGRAMVFSLGKRVYGEKWLIQSYTVKGENYAVNGHLIDATISLSLIEYDERMIT